MQSYKSLVGKHDMKLFFLMLCVMGRSITHEHFYHIIVHKMQHFNWHSLVFEVECLILLIG